MYLKKMRQGSSFINEYNDGNVNDKLEFLHVFYDSQDALFFTKVLLLDVINWQVRLKHLIDGDLVPLGSHLTTFNSINLSVIKCILSISIVTKNSYFIYMQPIISF